MRDFLTYSALLLTGEHFKEGYWVSPPTYEACWEPHLSRLQPKLNLSEGSPCRQHVTTQKVRMVSPLQVIASHPWCCYPLTHAHLRTKKHTQRCSALLSLAKLHGCVSPYRKWGCLFLKSSAPTAQKVRNITSIYISARRLLLSLRLSNSLWARGSLYLQCLTHRRVSESR